MKQLFMVVLIMQTMTAGAADHRLLINSSGPGEIAGIAYSRANDLLFVGERDGTIRVWRQDSRRLVSRFSVGGRSIRKLAVSPDAAALAVVEYSGSGAPVLSVWDWNRGTSLFTHRLSEIPHILEFSPRGSFIVVSKTEWNSLSFLDAKTGAQVNFFRDGFGIVSHLFVSDTEHTLMTYLPSAGQLIYWNLREGTRRSAPIRTMTDLASTRTLSPRHIAAIRDNGLLVIDSVTGALSARRELGQGTHSLAVDQASQRLAVLTALSDSIASLRIFAFEGGALSELSRSEGARLSGVTAFVAGRSGFFLARRDGEILHAGFDGALFPVASNRIVPVRTLAAIGSSVHIAAGRNLISLRTDTGTLGFQPFGENIPLTATVSTPFSRGNIAGLLDTNDGRLIAWSTIEPEVLELDPADGRVLRTMFRTPSPLLSLRSSGPMIYTLERGGTLSAIDGGTGAVGFRFTYLGLLCIEPVDRDVVYAGRSAIAGSPVMAVNTRTGETVNIALPGISLVYDLVHDAAGATTYFIGLKQTEQGSRTVLGSFRDVNRASLSVIDTLPVEDLGGDLLVDGWRRRLLSTAGNTAIRVYADGRRMGTFPATTAIPRQIRADANHLYTVDADGSISVWNRHSDERLGSFSVMLDGSWVFLSDDGWYAASSGFDESVLHTIDERGRIIDEPLVGLRVGQRQPN